MGAQAALSGERQAGAHPEALYHRGFASVLFRLCVSVCAGVWCVGKKTTHETTVRSLSLALPSACLSCDNGALASA